MTLKNTPSATSELTKSPEKNCFSLLEQLPIENSYKGNVIFLGRFVYEDAQNYYSRLSSLDLGRHEIIFLPPEKILSAAVSPDHEKYAVVDAVDNLVKVYSNNGQLIKTFSQSESTFVIDRWLDNERIALVVWQPRDGVNYLKYPKDQVVINISTDQKNVLASDYPDIDKVQGMMSWGGGSTTSYDASLTRVVYPSAIESDYLRNSGKGYILYDVVNNVKLLEFVTGDFTVGPKWAPDGSKFIINSPQGDGEFYMVTRDGVVAQISHMNVGMTDGSSKTHYSSDSFSWSPDGRFLAFWLEVYSNSSLTAKLAILDTYSGEVTDTCISAGIMELGTPDLPYYYAPLWSTDGKSLITVSNWKEGGNYQTILVDLDDEYAAIIGEDLFPIGWLLEMVE